LALRIAIFLLIAGVFTLVAVLCAFATFSRSPTVRRTATRAIYGSLAAALVSAALAAWFFHRAKATPSPPMSLGIAALQGQRVMNNEEKSLEECLAEAAECDQLAGLARSVAACRIMELSAPLWRKRALGEAEQCRPHLQYLH
jgi:hypothetical protein